MCKYANLLFALPRPQLPTSIPTICCFPLLPIPSADCKQNCNSISKLNSKYSPASQFNFHILGASHPCKPEVKSGYELVGNMLGKFIQKKYIYIIII